MTRMDPSRPDEAAYAGISTFGKLPLVLDPSDLAGADVAILGAPTDELVSYRPGARFGPRAIRASDPIGWSPASMPNMDVGADPFEVLSVVDHGDVPTVPGYPLTTHERIRAMVAAVCEAGAIPIVLGGDHSIAHPDAGAVAAHVAPEALGLIHFDAHADDAYEEPRLSHGTPLRLLVEEGSIRGEHIVQIGLRGYWPPTSDFEWARQQGFRWHLMNEIDERGLGPVLDDALAEVAGVPHVFLSVDIDVCDPGFAPGTGTPEPGGLTPRELLRAVRRIAAEAPLAGVEVVEVSPPYDHADVTALLAHRVVLETLSGLALRKLGRGPEPERSH
jgi:agmatinase